MTIAARHAPGLYLHIPFCSAICPYCDFAVQVGSSDARRRFVDSLLHEIELVSTADFEAPFDTVYFGGGTPSMLGAEDLERLLGAARHRLKITDDAEIYLEANPEDIDRERLASWRALGIGTLSLGVQSFDDAELRFLGRRHSARQAVDAVELALAAGFRSVSVDVIFGLPDQQPTSLRQSLDVMIDLGPQHVSCYELEIHRRTTFGKLAARGRLQSAGEDSRAELFELTHDVLSGAGYSAYEVSNFASGTEYRSRHNQKHWCHTPYLGLGPSAHSYTAGQRWWNHRSTARWQRLLAGHQSPIAEREMLSPADLALEAAMLGLRTVDGLDLGAVEVLCGIDLETKNASRLSGWRDHGLVEFEGRSIKPTRLGLAVADRLASELDI